MSNKKHLEGNELIADFMGLVFNPETTIHFPKGTWFKGAVGHCAEKGLAYETSWDWLMPVFQKYCEAVEPILSQSRTRISFCCDFVAGVWGNDIETSYKSILKGIKWYNETHK